MLLNVRNVVQKQNAQDRYLVCVIETFVAGKDVGQILYFEATNVRRVTLRACHPELSNITRFTAKDNYWLEGLRSLFYCLKNKPL